MSGGSSIRWELANQYGIWMGNGWGDPGFVESAADPWNSGHVNDVLVLAGGGLLAASDTGGIWTLSASGAPALCLSDTWEHCMFRSLALGVGSQQIFAGGEALYMTDVSAPVPLLSWMNISTAPYETAMIHRVLVLWEIGTIVLACDLGILWAIIPASGSAFSWQQAEVEGVTGGGFYDLAAGVQHKRPATPGHPEGRITQDIIAGGAGGLPIGRVFGGVKGGPVTSPADSSAGIFAGTWDDDGTLRLRRSDILISGGPATTLQRTFGAVSVASCPGQRSRAYACCSQLVANDSPHLFGILRSDDGGKTWTRSGDNVNMVTDLSLATMAGHQGSYNNCIAASNWDPDIVAFGFNNTFLSFDGGVSWTPIGIDDQAHYTRPRHLHPDIHGLTFTDPFADAPQDLLISSDGGVAALNWANGPWIVEGDSTSGHGPLEAVVLEGNSLMHYTRPADQPLAPFTWQVEVTKRATGSGCIIVSSRWAGSRWEYDLVVLEDSDLVHYWTDNSTSPPTWNRAAVITSNATGPGCIIESNYYTGSIANFEVVVPEGTNLMHYWHSGVDRNTPWTRTPTPITTHAASAACFIQSDFPFNADNGNFELVVLENAAGVVGPGLVHYWRDHAFPYPWSGPTMITRDATSQGCLFQSYGGSGRHGDFQVVVQQGRELAHWVRDNAGPPYDWHYVGSILGPYQRASGPGCAFQGSYGADPGNGNFELAACVEGDIEHRYRDTAFPSMPWSGKQVISRAAFTARSQYNRQLPNLQFYGADRQPLGTLSVSRLIPGLAAGGTQDNGVLYSITEHDSAVPVVTPWFQPEGGDGGPVAFLPARSFDGPIFAAGRVLIECNNEEDAIGLRVGAKSRRWDNPSRRLIGYPDPGHPVVPLASVSPYASPAPDPAHGLVDPLLEPVTEPRYRRRGAYMCAMGATGHDVYGLFVEDAANEGDFAPPRRWEYIGSTRDPDRKPEEITGLASLDGMTILVSTIKPSAKPYIPPDGRIYRMDTDTGNTSILTVDAAITAPSLYDIAIISPLEAYGITEADAIARWDGARWQPTSPFPAGTGLIAITADRTHDPPVIFVASTNRVFVSTDRGASWRDASAGLPMAVQCSDIDWLDEGAASRLYLSTYGRSVWTAAQTEP